MPAGAGNCSLKRPLVRKTVVPPSEAICGGAATVNRATALVAEGTVDPKAHGLDRPILRIEATLAGGGTVGPLIVGPASGDAHPASAGNPPAVYLLPAETVDRILKAFADLKG